MSNTGERKAGKQRLSSKTLITEATGTVRPAQIGRSLFLCYQVTRRTDFLEMVKQRCQFRRWFASHYYINRVTDERFIVH